jgi:hypothetical protein
MDARLLEMWLRLTADAVRGADDARRALQALSQGPLSGDAFSRWLQQWQPGGSFGSPGEAVGAGEELKAIAEEWWKAMGVVPRYRYTELLEHYEQLKTKLQEAEETISRLKRLIRQEGREAEASAVLEAWEKVTQETLRMQEEWVRLWSDPWESKE